MAASELLKVSHGAQKLLGLAVEEAQTLAVLLVLFDGQQVDRADFVEGGGQPRLFFAQLAPAGFAGVDSGLGRWRRDRRVRQQLAQGQRVTLPEDVQPFADPFNRPLMLAAE